MKKKILVTGAAGFIGFHLAKKLMERGDFVIGYDNFNDYYPPQLKRARAAELKKIGVEIIEDDIRNNERLNLVVTENQITHIAHLAAQAGVRYSIKNPQAYVQSNLEGFVSILETCKKHPHIKLTYASSSSVYGLNQKTPFSESDRTDHQASLYGVTKKSNELLAATYNHLYKIPVTGLRFFTVYGPWGRPDMAYYSFTDAIYEGRTVEIFNYGKMKRDFTYIDDIIDGTVAAIDLGAELELFNLGNNNPVELLEFIKILEQATGKKMQCDFIPMQQGDVTATYADITHSQTKLGFIPKTPLSVGIPKFVDWYNLNLPK